MSYIIIVSILFIFVINKIDCNTLHSRVSKQFEKHSKVNKGVWIKNHVKNDPSERIKSSQFLFRPVSIEIDNVGQNNYDPFNIESIEASTLYSSLENRNKRSVDYQRRRRFDTNTKYLANNQQIPYNETNEKISSLYVNKINSANIFKDYPYEVSVFLENFKREYEHPTVDVSKIINTNIYDNNSSVSIATELNALENFLTSILNSDSVSNITLSNNNTIPKRSMVSKNDYETRLIKKIVITEPNNTTKQSYYNNNQLKIENNDWRRIYPVYDTHTYKVIPKTEMKKNRFVTERGLLRVLALLTNTFKKIMRQHSNIKKIHEKLLTVNVNETALMMDRLQDFDTKYRNLLKIVEKLTLLEDKIKNQGQCLKNKESELIKSFNEFEMQQKKFLAQQAQFFSVQKMMLAQNEKINFKQNMIAKTQSEITVRQHNFARIIKKTKYLHSDSKTATTAKPQFKTFSKDQISKTNKPIITQPTTPTPQSTESIKINLFAVPPFSRLQNKDKHLLRDKDDQAVDDLVYKYYFNNTFIDYLMRNQILSNFLDSVDKDNQIRHVKYKRNDNKPNTTILLPVNTTEDSLPDLINDMASSDIISSELLRERRWINHHSKKVLRKKHRGKHLQANTYNKLDVKKITSIKRNNSSSIQKPLKTPLELGHKDKTMNKTDPFVIMATKFCSEIGQNTNTQMLKWCIEKALRRLKVMEVIMTVPLPHVKQEQVKKENQSNTKRPTTEGSTNNAVIKSTVTSTSSPPSPSSHLASQHSTTSDDIFFPDNDELESKLKDFEEKPDTEGNVYFDGSLHASEILTKNTEESSELLPDLTSNSDMQVDPGAFDLMLRRNHLRGFLAQRRNQKRRHA